MIKNAKGLLNSALEQSVLVKKELTADLNFQSSFQLAAELLLATRIAGGTIYICGNGGSACDAMHFNEELVARYAKERKGIRSQHFMDMSTITCWGNDYSFETIFSRQVETFCTPLDVFVAISTSGNSKNIIAGLKAAKEKKVPTILLTGKDGGIAKSIADISLIVKTDRTDRIQEAHILAIHAFCEFLEQDL